MALEKVSTILADGRKRGYGVAAFNCHNFESIKYVIDAAQEEQVAVIVQMYPGVRTHMPISTFAATCRDLAAKVKVPVGLHLDHCSDFDLIMYSIKNGFQSIIVDAAKYDYAYNAQLTKDVVRAAHPMGIDVEAELGFVGSGANASDYTDPAKYTKPEEAVRFVEETGIDSLAVAVGNGHGAYTVPPQLDFPLIQKLTSMIKVPLVMHGCSGIPDEQLSESAIAGMVKFNIGTAYRNAFYYAEEKQMATDSFNKNIIPMLAACKADVIEFLRHNIRVLNPNNVKAF